MKRPLILLPLTRAEAEHLSNRLFFGDAQCIRIMKRIDAALKKVSKR
jgi:hypothetical protein